MMTSAQVVETSVTITDNSPSQDYTHPDDQTTVLYSITCYPWVLNLLLYYLYYSLIHGQYVEALPNPL